MWLLGGDWLALSVDRVGKAAANSVGVSDDVEFLVHEDETEEGHQRHARATIVIGEDGGGAIADFGEGGGGVVHGLVYWVRH